MISNKMCGLDWYQILYPQILLCAQHGRRTNGLSIIETFKLIISEEICDIIIRKTNRKAKKVTENEFDAYLGILLLSGVTNSGYVHT